MPQRLKAISYRGERPGGLFLSQDGQCMGWKSPALCLQSNQTSLERMKKSHLPARINSSLTKVQGHGFFSSFYPQELAGMWLLTWVILSLGLPLCRVTIITADISVVRFTSQTLLWMLCDVSFLWSSNKALGIRLCSLKKLWTEVMKAPQSSHSFQTTEVLLEPRKHFNRIDVKHSLHCDSQVFISSTIILFLLGKVADLALTLDLRFGSRCHVAVSPNTSW